MYQHTSAQYCCLASESICAKPPRTRAFIRVLCTELDSKWRGGLRLANCFARFHQLSHCTTMFALNGGGDNGSVSLTIQCNSCSVLTREKNWSSYKNLHLSTQDVKRDLIFLKSKQTRSWLNYICYIMCNKRVIGEREGHLNIQFKYWTFISEYLKTLFVLFLPLPLLYQRHQQLHGVVG